MGDLGIEGRIGWYFPTYMLDVNQDLLNWRSLKYQINTDLFLPGVSVINQTNVQDQLVNEFEAMVTSFNNCNQTANFQQKAPILKISVFEATGVSSDSPGFVLTPNPQDQWVSSEQQIIDGLNLNMQTYIVPYPSEQSLISMMENATMKKETFLAYFWTPHEIFDPRSHLNLTRMQLLDWNDQCSTNLSLVQCIYPIDYLQKFCATSLTLSAPRVFSFAQKFSYRTNQGKLKTTTKNNKKTTKNNKKQKQKKKPVEQRYESDMRTGLLHVSTRKLQE